MRPPSVVPMGSTFSAFTIRPMKPATATGCKGIVIVATARVPRAPSGTLSTPFPMMASRIPPPSEDCRSISNGMLGSILKSEVILSCAPTTIAAMDATIPTSGPATEKSNMACRFFGGSLNVVTVVVTPVIMDGTKVGNVGLIPYAAAARRWPISCAIWIPTNVTKRGTLRSVNHDRSGVMPASTRASSSSTRDAIPGFSKNG
mmetsp:Transcript_25796/g.48808  ORF Transcript_25796/g.48808 Transcript_25796/m.48808 type:complete len:203 (-) Transcript_25796:1032-1640(-)